jgi:hypothetical protein
MRWVWLLVLLPLLPASLLIYVACEQLDRGHPERCIIISAVWWLWLIGMFIWLYSCFKILMDLREEQEAAEEAFHKLEESRVLADQ